MASFPYQRMRRLRRNESLRGMFSETTLATQDLIYPLFVVPGKKVKNEIESMPGIHHLSVDQLILEAETVSSLGIPAVIVFGLPETKDERGTAAYSPHGVVQNAIRELKRSLPDLIIITDVCLCQYTTHGHCGVVTDGCIDNDKTIGLLAKTAVSHAEAGADIVAPSDMMDGRIAAIRSALESAGFHDTIIMSYAVKYASAFYSPFREAAESSPQFGDRRSYQMDPSNIREALREVQLDIDEGADVVMVKPALPYLDVISTVGNTFNIPLAAYNVSGMFAMVKSAAHKGLLDEQPTVLEILTAIKRAGADIIITYHAKDAARWLSNV